MEATSDSDMPSKMSDVLAGDRGNLCSRERKTALKEEASIVVFFSEGVFRHTPTHTLLAFWAKNVFFLKIAHKRPRNYEKKVLAEHTLPFVSERTKHRFDYLIILRVLFQ
jgi:hypothetical protein